jgi:anti-sigma factor RsiW
MICDDALVLVHALADGELDAGHARDVEAHVASCAGCAAELAAARETKRALSGPNLHLSAPASLRARVEGAIPKPQPVTNRRTLLRGFALGSAFSALAATGIGFIVLRDMGESRVMGDAISAHLRSLQGEHLTDVLSTDQHTVKPWFEGKLDFAPHVEDPAAAGFALIGGRLDYLDGRPVAALTYRHRLHVVNLFEWPAGKAADSEPAAMSLEGYVLVHWRRGGLEYWAVSDVEREDLLRFARLVSPR